ncbi:hypothetical protein B0H14DRAFT_2565484 [Mycena olivaceomarginata]|nr:hypothetical protein B0H14DRAFT_2565484 [Mycena olivaceomarginata]
MQQEEEDMQQRASLGRPPSAVTHITRSRPSPRSFAASCLNCVDTLSTYIGPRAAQRHAGGLAQHLSSPMHVPSRRNLRSRSPTSVPSRPRRQLIRSPFSPSDSGDEGLRKPAPQRRGRGEEMDDQGQGGKSEKRASPKRHKQ